MASWIASITQLLATEPRRPHTLAEIATGLGAATEDHAAISATLVKLRRSNRAERVTVPATSTKGRREIAAYQLTEGANP